MTKDTKHTIRLSEDESAFVRAIADTEYEGNFSQALRFCIRFSKEIQDHMGDLTALMEHKRQMAKDNTQRFPIGGL